MKELTLLLGLIAIGPTIVYAFFNHFVNVRKKYFIKNKIQKEILCLINSNDKNDKSLLFKNLESYGANCNMCNYIDCSYGGEQND